MFYEALNPDFQAAVDQWAADMAPLSWSERANLMAARRGTLPAVSLGEPGERSELDDEPPEPVRVFVAAVIERLGEEPVVDVASACFYRLSADPAHREAGDTFVRIGCRYPVRVDRRAPALLN